MSFKPVYFHDAPERCPACNAPRRDLHRAQKFMRGEVVVARYGCGLLMTRAEPAEFFGVNTPCPHSWDAAINYRRTLEWTSTTITNPETTIPEVVAGKDQQFINLVSVAHIFAKLTQILSNNPENNQ